MKEQQTFIFEASRNAWVCLIARIIRGFIDRPLIDPEVDVMTASAARALQLGMGEDIDPIFHDKLNKLWDESPVKYDERQIQITRV